MKVCIDPGHGGYDPGAVGPTGLQEKAAALEIALEVGQLLLTAGLQVGCTRTSDTVPWPSNVNQDLAARCQIANQSGADLFVSIHINSGSATAAGTETYCLQMGGNGEKAARLVQTKLVQALGLRDRGVKTANFYVLRKTNMPAILTEICFISNPSEEALLRQPGFITKAAQAIAAGICSYFGMTLSATASVVIGAVTINARGQAITGKLIDGSTWGPVAGILQALGIPYTWDGATRTVNIP